jgi:hypothetical protein
MHENILGTKADTLINLKDKIEEFVIPKTYVFTIKDWVIRRKSIVKYIKK